MDTNYNVLGRNLVSDYPIPINQPLSGRMCLFVALEIISCLALTVACVYIANIQGINSLGSLAAITAGGIVFTLCVTAITLYLFKRAHARQEEGGAEQAEVVTPDRVTHQHDETVTHQHDYLYETVTHRHDYLYETVTHQHAYLNQIPTLFDLCMRKKCLSYGKNSIRLDKDIKSKLPGELFEKLVDYQHKNHHYLGTLFVKSIYGNTLSFYVDLTLMSVRQLKELILTKTGLSVEMQRLIFAGKNLNDDQTLLT